MTGESPLVALLVAQGILGGIDTLLNHELIERLPYRLEARTEIGLHALREAIYGSLFLGLAWLAWHGALALVIAGLVFAEVLVSASDELVENKIRVLPQNERVLHFFLALNLGLIIAALLSTLAGWFSLPTGLARADHGLITWALSLLGIGAAAWSVRDLLAWRRLRRESA